MRQASFVTFEIAFTLLWILIFLLLQTGREAVLAGFMLLMFANGVWHLTWARIERGYVPDVVTAFAHIVVFYFSILT